MTEEAGKEDTVVVESRLDIKRTMERIGHMFNFTSPDEKIVEYYIQEQDYKFQIFSKAYPINNDGTGVAHNYVAEKSTREEAEELIQKIKNLR